MTDSLIIDLAHEKPFRLGAVTVNPPVRELGRDDGARENLEPRVMQVLVALAQAKGELLSRDDLTERCWGGVVVGDDSINRVISRLRRSAEEIGKGSFRIDTVTKVGYRLVAHGVDKAAGSPAASPWTALPEAPAPPTTDRRVILAAGGLGVFALGATGASLYLRAGRDKPPANVATLYAAGWTAMGNSVPEQVAQAAGLFRQVVEAAPKFADGWGSLAYAYAVVASSGDPASRSGYITEARSAARTALRLEPHNALGELGLSELAPLYGNWAFTARTLDAAVRRHPKVRPLSTEMEWVYAATGRMEAGMQENERGLNLGPPSVITLYRHIMFLWAANRLVEADKAVRDALETYRRSRPLWFVAFYYLMYSGRPELALAMADDTSSRPPGVEQYDYDIVIAVAQAIRSRAKADIDKALALSFEAAHRARGYAENAIQYASFLGRQDMAFEVADAYYFGRGFQLGALSFSEAAGQYYGEPRTYFLFLPSVAPIRGDPRFDRLVGEIGLKSYWEKSGHRPDYLSAKT